MEASPAPWISALRHSHGLLRAAAGPLDASQLRQPSYDPGWSIAQVLAHLGSQAEIFGLVLDAGLSGQEPPGRDAFAPVWQAWSERSPRAQAADALHADNAAIERFENLDAGQLERLRLQLFGMDLDAAGLARVRLSEHALHTWDIAVALDPAATVAPDAVGLLIDTLGRLVAGTAKADGTHRRVQISTSSPVRQFILDIGETVTLAPAPGNEGLPELALPAEALIRLVYGRLDRGHTPPVQTRRVDLDELRQIFPGF